MVSVSDVKGEAAVIIDTTDVGDGAIDVYSSKGGAVVKIGNASGGGLIDIYNSFEKKVVSVQSNKANDGVVYINDVNGKPANYLDKDRP